MAQPQHRGEPGPVRTHEGRGIPRRSTCPAGTHPHGCREPEHAGPGPVPDPPPGSLAYRRRLVGLPTVRLHPLHLGRAGGITHSLCTLEFEDHRLLYDWILERLGTSCHPQQIEFARLSLEYTVVSKRKLQLLVQDGHVDGWDDPRLPTLRGLRRRVIRRTPFAGSAMSSA